MAVDPHRRGRFRPDAAKVTRVNFAFTPEQEQIREAIAKICARFDDAYWLKKDKEGGFHVELHRALARDGWLGIAMP